MPGYVSFTSSAGGNSENIPEKYLQFSLPGSPYLQTLSSLLETHYKEMDLSDIHLMVKRRLAKSKLGESNRKRERDRLDVFCCSWR